MKKVYLLIISVLTTLVSFSQPVINEVDADTPGTDAAEFIELLWTPNTSLNGFVVVFYNGSNDQSYAAFDLSSFSTDANGFFILANTALVQAGDLDIGATNILQNGADAVALYQDDVLNFPANTPVTNLNLIDALVYGTADPADADLLTGLGESVQYDESLNSNSANESLQRQTDGTYATATPTFRAVNVDLSSTPLLNATPNSISNLNYVEGSGPSNEGSFNVSGSNLSGNVTVTAPANFEVSTTSGGSFSSSVSLTPAGGTLNTTTIFVRLSAGLTANSFSGNVTISSTGASNASVMLSGTVVPNVPLTNALVITGVLDGPLTGGTPKAVELFVRQNISDLSIFGITTVTNGQGAAGGSGSVEFTFPAQSATAGSFIYLTGSTQEFLDFFGFSADLVNGAISGNGDDAYELYENGQIIDVFGDSNVDGSGQPWDYLDGWAYRVNNTGPDGNTFILANWTFSGINALDGELTNSNAANPWPIQNFTLSIDNFDLNQNPLRIYPNPALDGVVNIVSANNFNKDVEVYDLLGKRVLQASGIRSEFNVSALRSGVYLLKITEDGKTQTRKLVVRN